MPEEPIAAPTDVDAPVSGGDVFDDAVAPVSQEPPVDTPINTDTLPDTPPVDTPPVDTPPVDVVPPVDTPPVDTPPTAYTVDQLKELGVLDAEGKPTGKTDEGAPAPLTDEEFNTKMNVFTPSDKHIEALHEGGEQAVAAMGDIVRGAVKEAVTFSRVLANQELNAYKQQLAPYVEMAQQQIFNEEVAEFYTANPNLKGHEQVVDMAYKNTLAAGVKYKSNEEAYKAIAAEANKLITTIRDGGKPPPTQPTNQPPANAPKRMPPLSGAGQGASSTDGSAVAPQGPPGIEVF